MRSGIRTITSALFMSLAAAGTSSAQISVNGGTQNLVWPANCSTTVQFQNNTALPLAGLWIGINLDATTNPPRSATSASTTSSQGGPGTWTDNEDFDNGDAGEADEVDSTPLGASDGWHRVQARSNADVLAAGEIFTIKLCDSGGGSLSGRTIYFVPMAQQPGMTGGDSSDRTEVPMSVSQGFPTGSVTIDGVGAPPGSTSFSVGVINNDGSRQLRKLKINPPTGITIVTASADGGAFYDSTSRTIIWPTPVPIGGTSQVNQAGERAGSQLGHLHRVRRRLLRRSLARLGGTAPDRRTCARLVRAQAPAGCCGLIVR